jgi:hypothetical protein
MALGIEALRAGAHFDAIEYLTKALADENVSPLRQPEAYASLARAYVSAGATARAVDLLESCLAETEARPEQKALYVRFAIYLSRGRSSRQRLAAPSISMIRTRRCGCTGPRRDCSRRRTTRSLR